MKVFSTLLIGASLSAAPVIAPAIAQSPTTDSALPESMRIEQETTQQNANDPSMPANRGARPTTEAPGGASGPVESNRIDPAAPSPNRLQIDDGASAAVRQNPDVNALHPGSEGTSYNTILRGSPSTSGTSAGASSGVSGMGTGGATGGSSAGGSSSGGGH